MPVIYLKSSDERTVISIRGKNPRMEDWHRKKGYKKIEYAEFKKLRRRIQRGVPQPKRIQRMRVKNWKMPPNTIYVGRPTKWGNPWTIETALNTKFWLPEECAQVVVDEFEAWLNNDEDMSMGEHLGMWKRPEIQKQRAAILVNIKELRGKDLACWCPLDQPCHANVLLKLANKE